MTLACLKTSLVMVATSLAMVATSLVKVSTSLVKVSISLVMVATSLVNRWFYKFWIYFSNFSDFMGDTSNEKKIPRSMDRLQRGCCLETGTVRAMLHSQLCNIRTVLLTLWSQHSANNTLSGHVDIGIIPPTKSSYKSFTR